jgi:hypothetical protein
MLSVVVLNANMLSAIKLIVIMLNVNMLNANMQSVVMLYVIILSALASFQPSLSLVARLDLNRLKPLLQILG